MFKIDYNSYRSVASFNQRVRFLVLHYTAQNFVNSVKFLTGKSVSAHYLVPDPTDTGYQAAGFNGVRIFNLVDENERVWHAGASKWGNRNNLNDTSIGIEIVNLASGNGEYITFPPPLIHSRLKRSPSSRKTSCNVIRTSPRLTWWHTPISHQVARAILARSSLGGNCIMQG